jgi:hypothetical protein
MPKATRYKPTRGDRARLAQQRLPQPPDSAIDLSDIPEASPAQLRAARRARVNRGGRPPGGDQKRIAISFRVAPELLAQLRTVAAARGIGYQTLAHALLEEAIATAEPRRKTRVPEWQAQLDRAEQQIAMVRAAIGKVGGL